MGLRKFKDIIKSIGAPNKDDTLLGVFNGKTAQKSIDDILKVVDFKRCDMVAISIKPISVAKVVNIKSVLGIEYLCLSAPTGKNEYACV